MAFLSSDKPGIAPSQVTLGGRRAGLALEKLGRVESFQWPSVLEGGCQAAVWHVHRSASCV